MRNTRHMSLRRGTAALCALCAVLLCARAEDYTYQSLTNLGPRASSRVLLLNDDTNPACPIEGQGYHTTNVNDVAVGGTYWWHDDVTEAPSTLPRLFLNLLPGSSHQLRQKLDSSGSYRVLWTLNECRTGSGGYNSTTANNSQRNFLPWSDTCQPIDAAYAKAPIPSTWTSGSANLGGIKQVAHITMRCTTDACVYSPFYEEGAGGVFFDAVNGFTMSAPDEICLEVAYDIKDGYKADETFGDGLDLDHYDWNPVPCDVFAVNGKSTVTLEHSGVTVIPLRATSSSYRDTMYYRVRYTPPSGEDRLPMRFRIRRNNVQRNSDPDYNNTIFIDNIVVPYPGVVAEVSSSGIRATVLPDTDSRKNGRRADLGHVGAFTEPLLGVGVADARPRMAFSAVTNGAPPWIEPKASVSKAECVYRWRYLDQAFGEWKTNVSENISILNGTNVVWDSAIDAPDRIGDIEYSYGAWVSGTRYRYLDFANNSQIAFPDDTAAETYVQCATNYTARIRAGASPWQEMHVVTEVYTNLATLASVTNDWTMELTASNMWRGFVDTRTNYMGKVAHIRIVGRNRWESGGFTPAEESRTWYMPEIDRIPDGYKALAAVPEGGETDISLDCSTGYLSIDFNDEAETFTINHAEYQDFNLWTPQPGGENRYVGDYVNTTYVGRAKTAYNLDAGAWELSRSSSAWWWENFDAYAGNPDFPFNVPYGQNQKTPNGWTFDNGMYINGYFTADTNKTANGMALQLQGRGNGTIALIDPTDRPNGIGTISFTARLAQYIEFGDFFCNLDGYSDSNYAFSAKAAMTHTIQNNSRPEDNDISCGVPSVSLVAYYRPSSGCYEVRISRVWASQSSIWSSGNGVMELAIYRWNIVTDASGNRSWQSKKLASRRLGNVSGYGTTSADRNYNQGNFLAPVGSGSGVDNDKWTSVYVAAYNTANGTYVEGAVSRDQVSSYSLSGDNLFRGAVLEDMKVSGRMFHISFTDNEIETNVVYGVSRYKNLYHSKGSYGVCSTECPAAFGALAKYTVSSVGPYYNAYSKFASPTLQRDSIEGGDWGSVSPYRMITWDEHDIYYPDRPSYVGKWGYGVCAAPISQTLTLLTAPSGNSSDWTSTGLELSLSSYQATNLVFSPHTLETCNVKLSVGGTQSDSRTDVVVDDLELSQWAAGTSSDSLGEMGAWAYSHGWITSSTNDVYKSGGASTNDPNATITKCGYVVYKVPGTTDDYVYVFTNTVNGALGSYANFIPSANMTMVGAFGLGGGGGGGAGGGGGGGGSAFAITNSVAFNIGDEIRVLVGSGGNPSGGNTDPNQGTKKTYRGDWFGASGNGGNSYLHIRSLGTSGSAYTDYYAYGGGRGGNWRDGGSYVQGGDGTSSRGAGGGSARYSVSTTGAATKNSAGNATYGSGMGAGVTNRNESAGGGGGGGLVVYRGPTSAPLSPSDDVLVRGGDGGHGTAGLTGVAGLGGSGFKVADIPSEAIRNAIKSIYGLGDSDGMGGGGGGGGGTNTAANAAYYGYGAGGGPGKGRDGGTDGDAMSATYETATYAAYARNGLGGGGGGGSIRAIMNSSGSSANNWLTRGGRGGDGLVAIHVRVNDRAVLLQPMRGSPTSPMAVRTPFMNGISSLGVSWKWADPNALLRVQAMTNDVNEGNIEGRSLLLEGGWHDKGVIDFSRMSATERAGGSTNILIGYRAPISGIARILMDTNIVAAARVGSTNGLDSLYGAVAITALVAMDEPQLDDRSWWGWNIMSTDAREYGSLYDHAYDVTAGLLSGRSCSLNFSGVAGTGDDDPLFAEDPAVAQYSKHDPFVQTPNFTNGIGQVIFSARMLETNGVNGWVSISGSADPNEEDDDNWTVITNIEVTSESPLFRQHVWRMPSDYSGFTAVRLSAFAAAEGRNHQADSKVPFGATGSTLNPVPIQRVLLDEVTVMQPMTPGLAFAYPPRPYRFNRDRKTDTNSLPADKAQSADVQPLLNESFGMQVQLVPAGLDEELDRSSVRVFMSWYAGESPWGYVNWKGESGANLGIELAKADDWSENNLVYHSSPTDSSTLVPPQIAGSRGFEIVQYHIYVTYCDRNGNEHDRVMQVGTDWTEPSWYVFVGGSPYNRSGVTCAYTILDEISPKRAWINEINMFRHGDLGDAAHQYVEVAVPQGLGLTGWSIDYLPYDTKIVSRPLVSFGYGDVVSSKTEHGSGQYAFIAVQSPKTKSAGTYSTAEHHYLDDGTWSESAFSDGVLNVRQPYAVRLLRPTGIVEHEIVFMCTNTSTSRVSYTYDGTNYLRVVKEALNDDAWIYVGADDNGTSAADYSLGVYTGHGESISCWTNWMTQTPGRLNSLVDGTDQYIDPSYFEPPEGSHLWVYVSVDSASRNTLWVKTGSVRSSSAVLIVPQDVTGTYSTSVVYEVQNWFDIASVVTNSYGEPAAAVAGPYAKDSAGQWTLDLSDMTLAEDSSRKFFVTASTEVSQNVPDAANGGIASDDPYYPAVLDWLQNYEEGDIHLARFYGMDNKPVRKSDGSETLLSLKEMYWLDIPPVSASSGDWEWILRAGMGGGNGAAAVGETVSRNLDGVTVTNVFVTVSMMISNRVTNAAYPPYTLRGLAPGSVSSNYSEQVSSWTSATFKVEGALQNGIVNDVWQPIRWFTLCPESFGAPGSANPFSRTIELPAPADTGYDWESFPNATPFYRFSIDERLGPFTIYQLNDKNALLNPPSGSGTP